MALGIRIHPTCLSWGVQLGGFGHRRKDWLGVEHPTGRAVWETPPAVAPLGSGTGCGRGADGMNKVLQILGG